MTLEQLSQLNERYQQKATELAELLPGSNLLTFCTTIIRSAKKLDTYLTRMVTAKSETNLYQQLENMEEEIDEMIFLLDKLDVANRARKIQLITDFIKRGYELMSLYSMCCDQILERRLKKQE